MPTEISVYLPFASIHNCRDLGGITNREGKYIVPGQLFRSANLAHASKHDLLTLEFMNLRHVIDLRTPEEVLLAPDRLPETATLTSDSVYKERDLSHSAGGQFKLIKEAADDMAEVFEQLYVDMINDPDSQQAWRVFFAMLLESEGPLLWHCTQGKDRTGIACALLLHALDVEEELIVDDYLQTNLYTCAQDLQDKQEVNIILRHALRKVVDADIDSALLAKKAYYDKAQQAIVQGWGSWQGYLRNAIGLQDRDFERLKTKYLRG